MRRAALAAAVGLVLADSSVVTLALPDILREFDATVSEVAWVLTAFNLVLALAAVPAARWTRRRSGVALIGRARRLCDRFRALRGGALAARP